MSDEIVYPQTLQQVWKYVHNEDIPGWDEKVFNSIYTKLLNILSGSLKKSLIPGINSYKDAQDAALDAFSSLLQGAYPVNIRSLSGFICYAKKYLARKNNPVQYELNGILHEALISLEENGVIERDADSKNRRISALTMFALSGTPVNQIASLMDYENNKYSVDTFTTKLRAGSAKHSRILTPTDAKELVLQLLQAFGGWTNKADIFKAMQHHIPEQMTIVSVHQEEEGDADWLENIAATEDDYIDEFDRLQTARIACNTAELIWERICGVSNKVFCLYYIPKTIMDKDVRMESIGKTSTVSDQNRKIANIVEDEMSKYLEENQGYKSKAVRNAVKQIFGKLYGTCTENGYNPGLYSQEVKAGDMEK